MTRRIVDLRDVNTQELVYPATHSDAVLMPDGKTVTEAIANSGSGGGELLYFVDATVETIINYASDGLYLYLNSAILDAAKSNKVICIPFRDSEKGYVVGSYKYDEDIDIDDNPIRSLTLYLSFDSAVVSYYYNQNYGESDGKIQFLLGENKVLGSKVEYVDAEESGGEVFIEAKEGVSYVVNGEISYLGFGGPTSVRFTTAESCIIEWFENFIFANGVIPELEPHTTYELSLSEGPNDTILAVLTPYKVAEGGGSSISSAAYPLVSHGTNDTAFTLTPNTYHVWDVVEQLDIALGEEIEGVVNEFVFQFSTGETPTALTLPEGLMWAKETNLSLSAYATYKVSIYNGLITLSEYNTYIVNEIKLTPIEGSTFIEWESKYPLAEDIHLYLLNSKYLGVMSAGQQWGELDRGYISGEYYCLISFTAGAEPDRQEITDGTYLYRIQETIELPPVFD